ncbi:shikimate dehydrogenase [Maritalea mediterranea]|uniref:Shikimate dehydrogenase (NADP(+)) n=1 Tax=Maritalea mediterranea TaxID=2909667 RepID=A0ABS9E228_9HYPH|nr:shikimate dehydrogenase [Maritalea mediterranea]MCF4096921.1 shikimate dehydrogenase [Maritalea mediterranea]
MTKKAFVTGNPIKHSKSPRLHGAWLQKYQIDGSYEAVETDEASFKDLIAAIRAEEWQGGNVTLPHKQLAFDQCDQLTPTATNIGAVNTIWRKGNQIWGDNTDGYGFVANLDHQILGWDQNRGVAIILGAGGAARAILYALVEKGYKKIYLLNRTLARAEQLAAEFDGTITPQTLDQFNQLAPNADFVVNTSAVGMQGSRFENLDVDKLPKSAIVTDIVYTPLMTPLLQDAEAHGLKIATGMGMLVFQAVPGFERWFGQKPEVDQQLMDKMLAEIEHG